MASNLYRKVPMSSFFHLKKREWKRTADISHSKAKNNVRCFSLPEDSPPNGDSGTQDYLVEMLRAEMAKQAVKDEIMQDVEKKKETLREIGEQLLEELREGNEIEKARADLAGTAALSETLDKLGELEEDVRKIREQIKADRQDLAEWESDAAAARSKGLFFKSLYQVEKGTSVAPDTESVRRVSETVTAPASEEISSPFRLYLFSYLAAALSLVLTADVFSPDPAWGLDALYGVLLACLAGAAFNERSAFTAASQGGPKPPTDDQNTDL